jgi:N6-L-threonylcarbamoyladenine synthase
MKILSIETSCDETAVAVLKCSGGLENPQFQILSQSLYSQVSIHEQYGGVYPALAKREHSKNLIPLLKKTLEESELKNSKGKIQKEKFQEKREEVKEILHREPELLEQFLEYITTIKIPEIDAIAVTVGPGLEPALWVGINFARALSLAWNKELIPVNHMEGHIYVPLIEKGTSIQFPALALLISGGHTELISMNNWAEDEILGATRDDAVGEAFDKIARLLSLPYPGGPQISKLAEDHREKYLEYENKWNFPRPMIHSENFDFSFSGLKTAVLYATKDKSLTNTEKNEIAREVEEAITDVLLSKAQKVLSSKKINTFILGGGVAANTYVRKSFTHLIENNFPRTTLLLPSPSLTTDNAVMIGVASYIRFLKNDSLEAFELRAQGQLSL